MQPTNLQVRRSLEALEAHAPPGSSTHVLLSPADADLCSGIVAGLGADPVIRPDRLAEARRRLVEGDQPTADDLATRMVGRLVCDRLR